MYYISYIYCYFCCKAEDCRKIVAQLDLAPKKAKIKICSTDSTSTQTERYILIKDNSCFLELCLFHFCLPPGVVGRDQTPRGGIKVELKNIIFILCKLSNYKCNDFND